jgi:adenylate cyclase
VAEHKPSLTWVVLTIASMLSVNLLAGITTSQTIDLMRSLSDFAVAVRAHDLTVLPLFRCVLYPLTSAVLLGYLWPIVRHFRAGAPYPAPAVVRRRVVNGPALLALTGFLGWVVGAIFFPVMTIVRFGTWQPELASQHVLSPLVNSFLAATTGYLVVDWIFRAQVVPYVFPEGRLDTVAGAHPLGLQMRLWIFLMAVAFLPLFTVLGLVQAAAARLGGGMDAGRVLGDLAAASRVTFGVYVALGVGLTVLLGRTLTRPVAAVVSALRRVGAGDLDVRVPVGAGDEVGVLEDGVNAMVRALRDREHIFQTFGRVVEPAVRDQLLAQGVRRLGERRRVTVLFCDLRGFTSFAEGAAPEQVVETLNEFFTEMTGWARACGGSVDKFIGDAMLVVFGLFDEVSALDAERAAAAGVRCGLGMRTRLAALNARRECAGRPALAMAVAVHVGDVVAGRIGAEDRHDYTVIGDTVNVAARLQQLCKDRGHDVVVSEGTYAAARGQGLTCPVHFREAVTLRGRREPVDVLGLGTPEDETGSAPN